VFLDLMFPNWKDRVTKMNQALKGQTENKAAYKARVPLGLGLIIWAAEFAKNGKELFLKIREHGA
jgi:hypothetical protein